MKYVHLIQSEAGEIICAMLNGEEAERFMEESESPLEARSVPLVQSEYYGSNRPRLFEDQPDECE